MCGRAVVPRYGGGGGGGGGVCPASMVFGLVCVLYGPIKSLKSPWSQRLTSLELSNGQISIGLLSRGKLS